MNVLVSFPPCQLDQCMWAQRNDLETGLGQNDKSKANVWGAQFKRSLEQLVIKTVVNAMIFEIKMNATKSMANKVSKFT